MAGHERREEGARDRPASSRQERKGEVPSEVGPTDEAFCPWEEGLHVHAGPSLVRAPQPPQGSPSLSPLSLSQAASPSAALALPPAEHPSSVGTRWRPLWLDERRDMEKAFVYPKNTFVVNLGGVKRVGVLILAIVFGTKDVDMD